MDSSSIEPVEAEERSRLPAQAETMELIEPGASDPFGDRNPVFQQLVTADEDIVGLVAYSIYKQNKLDWLLAFEKLHGRPPGDPELSAYILGESTARRLATYRYLAESTLKGSIGGKGGQLGAPRLAAGAGNSGGALGGSTISYLILAGVLIVAIFLAARFGLVAK